MGFTYIYAMYRDYRPLSLSVSLCIYIRHLQHFGRQQRNSIRNATTTSDLKLSGVVKGYDQSGLLAILYKFARDQADFRHDFKRLPFPPVQARINDHETKTKHGYGRCCYGNSLFFMCVCVLHAISCPLAVSVPMADAQKM